MSFLAQRRVQPELMDQPDIDAAEHRRALAGLRRVNALSGGVGAVWKELRTLCRSQPAGEPLRVLDLACGGGDVVARLARRAQAARLPIEFAGCDLSETALDVSRSLVTQHKLTGIDFFRLNALQEDIPKDYDVVMCSLFLHHLTDAEAVFLLRSMATSARRAVLVDDLLRTRWGYILCWSGCRLLTRSRIVHTDGPLSVQAAFTLDEIRQRAQSAGLTGISLRKHWPQRFLLSWKRQ